MDALCPTPTPSFACGNVEHIFKRVTRTAWFELPDYTLSKLTFLDFFFFPTLSYRFYTIVHTLFFFIIIIIFLSYIYRSVEVPSFMPHSPNLWQAWETCIEQSTTLRFIFSFGSINLPFHHTVPSSSYVTRYLKIVSLWSKINVNGRIKWFWKKKKKTI